MNFDLSVDLPAIHEPTLIHTSQSDTPHASTAKETLVRKYTPFVQSLASRYSRNNANHRDDLIQEGFIGLLEAMRRFNPNHEKSARFGTFATSYIRGYMLNYLRSEAKHAHYDTLDKGIGSRLDKDGSRQVETVVDGFEYMIIRLIDLKLFRRKLVFVLPCLTLRQREILQRRFLNEEKPVEIAAELGISPARVTQLTKEALRKLRVAFPEFGS